MGIQIEYLELEISDVILTLQRKKIMFQELFIKLTISPGRSLHLAKN